MNFEDSSDSVSRTIYYGVLRTWVHMHEYIFLSPLEICRNMRHFRTFIFWTAPTPPRIMHIRHALLYRKFSYILINTGRFKRLRDCSILNWTNARIQSVVVWVARSGARRQKHAFPVEVTWSTNNPQDFPPFTVIYSFMKPRIGFNPGQMRIHCIKTKLYHHYFKEALALATVSWNTLNK